jgi:hypothetical protein
MGRKPALPENGLKLSVQAPMLPNGQSLIFERHAKERSEESCISRGLRSFPSFRMTEKRLTQAKLTGSSNQIILEHKNDFLLK